MMTGKFVPQAQAVSGTSIGVPIVNCRCPPVRQVSANVIVWGWPEGGLITKMLPRQRGAVPGDLLLVGRFFRSRSSQTKKKNLVIFVTPRIIDAPAIRITPRTMPFGPNDTRADADGHGAARAIAAAGSAANPRGAHALIPKGPLCWIIAVRSAGAEPESRVARLGLGAPPSRYSWTKFWSAKTVNLWHCLVHLKWGVLSLALAVAERLVQAYYNTNGLNM
jgi:hypothetical protein